MLKNKVYTFLLAACALGIPVASSAFIVDGVVSVGDNYTENYTLGFQIEGKGKGKKGKKGKSTSPSTPSTSPSYGGVLRLGRGANANETGGNGDIFVLLEIPTEIHDLTFGANAAPGWNDGIAFKTVTGSENLAFTLDVDGSDRDVKIKMSSKDKDGGTGVKLEQDGGGAVLDASTSLAWNIAQFGPYADNADSPFCGNSPATDQACYDYLDNNDPNYEYKQMYEFQLDGSLFSDVTDNLIDIAGFISDSLVHASPLKSGEGGDGVITCINDPNVDCPVLEPPVSVTEPGSLGLLALGLLALRFRRKAA
jgi:hypothetical protein